MYLCMCFEACESAMPAKCVYMCACVRKFYLKLRHQTANVQYKMFSKFIRIELADSSAMGART